MDSTYLLTRSLGVTRVQSAACVSVQFSPSSPAPRGIAPSACGTCWTAGRSKKRFTSPLMVNIAVIRSCRGQTWRFSTALTVFFFFPPALSVTYRPDGQELAVATLNGEISFWNPQTASQTGSVAGRHDLETGRKETDKVTAKQTAKGK